MKNGGFYAIMGSMWYRSVGGCRIAYTDATVWGWVMSDIGRKLDRWTHDEELLFFSFLWFVVFCRITG